MPLKLGRVAIRKLQPSPREVDGDSLHLREGLQVAMTRKLDRYDGCDLATSSLHAAGDGADPIGPLAHSGRSLDFLAL